MGELISRLMRRWSEVGVAPNPGVSKEELAAFEAENCVRFPEDLRQFLQAANGIPFSELDGLSRLRPITEYFRIVDRVPSAGSHLSYSDNVQHYFCFADYNIEGSFWGILLRNDSALPTPVRVFGHDGGGDEIATSFREFLERYLSEEPDGMC